MECKKCYTGKVRDRDREKEKQKGAEPETQRHKERQKDEVAMSSRGSRYALSRNHVKQWCEDVSMMVWACINYVVFRKSNEKCRCPKRRQCRWY